jgi:hypothetical protein
MDSKNTNQVNNNCRVINKDNQINEIEKEKIRNLVEKMLTTRQTGKINFYNKTKYIQN